MSRTVDYNAAGEEIPAPRGPLARAAVAAVRFYQNNISALKMMSTCRFEPDRKSVV